MQQLVDETLRTIEVRARLYRRLVQLVVALAVGLSGAAVWVSAAILLYAPALGVLLITAWIWADSARVNRWRARFAESGVSPNALAEALASRQDIPQRTWQGMLKSLPHSRHSGYPMLFAGLALTMALACGARAAQARSVRWGIGAFAFLGLSALMRARVYGQTEAGHTA